MRFLFKEVLENIDRAFYDHNQLSKEDFNKFVKGFKKELLESELYDMFLVLAKKLPQSQRPKTEQGKTQSKRFNPNNFKNTGDKNDSEEDKKKEEVRLDIKFITEKWEKFKKDEDTTSGALNVTKIKQRFADFRKKIDVWKERIAFRNRIKRNFTKQKSSIRERLIKASTVEFTYDVEIV